MLVGQQTYDKFVGVVCKTSIRQEQFVQKFTHKTSRYKTACECIISMHLKIRDSLLKRELDLFGLGHRSTWRAQTKTVTYSHFPKTK